MVARRKAQAKRPDAFYVISQELAYIHSRLDHQAAFLEQATGLTIGNLAEAGRQLKAMTVNTRRLVSAAKDFERRMKSGAHAAQLAKMDKILFETAWIRLRISKILSRKDV